mgnify:CR=1 FL=1
MTSLTRLLNGCQIIHQINDQLPRSQVRQVVFDGEINIVYF